MRTPTTWFGMLAYLIPAATFMILASYAVFQKIRIERKAGRKLNETLRNGSTTVTGNVWLDGIIFLLVSGAGIAGLFYYIYRLKELV